MESTVVQVITGLILMIVFAGCLKASVEATKPENRLRLAITGWGAGVAVFWLVGISCYLTKPLGFYFVMPSVATILAVVFLCRALRYRTSTQVGR